MHKTDLIQYLLDSKVAKVQSVTATLDKRYENGELVDVDDNAICIYHMENGALGTMTASWTYYGEEDNGTVLYGTKGIMKLYANPAHGIEVCLASVYGGQHASAHVISRVFSVIFNRRTSLYASFIFLENP